MEFFDYNTYKMTADEVFELAERYEQGNECIKNTYLATELYYKSYSKGNTNARYPLLKALLLRNDLKDQYLELLPSTWLEQAVKELRIRACNKDPEAIFLMSCAFYDGFGLEHNESTAIELCKQLVDLEYPRAMNLLGIYNKNNDMYEEAIVLYKRAIDKGFYTSAQNLARLYVNYPEYVESDTEIERLYKMAADNDVMMAQHQYADLLMEGKYCEKNEQLAFHYYLQAAQHGYPQAKTALGRIYLEGIGREKNFSEAISWLTGAAENYCYDAVKLLQNLQEKIADSHDLNDQMREKVMVVLYKNYVLCIDQHLARIRFEKKLYQELGSSLYVRRDETIPTLMFVLYMNRDSFTVLKCKDENDCDIKATEWLKKGVEISDVPSIRLLGECYENDVPTLEERDYQNAILLYNKAYQMGSGVAGYLLGKLYFTGEGISKNVEKAIKYYKEAARRDCGEAYLELGNLYLRGEDLAENSVEAMRSYEAVTEQNCYYNSTYTASRCNLGYMYQYGIGIDADHLRATELYRQAISDDNNGTATCNLAYAIMKYDYLDSTDSMIHYYEEAVTKNNIRAMYNLALLYIKGEKIEKNVKKAIMLLKKASSSGLKIAGLMLAVLYKEGYGCERNNVLAKKYSMMVEGNRFKAFILCWILTHHPIKYYIRAEYLENQIIPENKDLHNRVKEFKRIEQKQDQYHNLETIISHLNDTDSLSDKARNAIVLIFEKGIYAPKSKVLADFWKKYSFVPANVTEDTSAQDEIFDIEAKLERAFDELFGSTEEKSEETDDESFSTIADKEQEDIFGIEEEVERKFNELSGTLEEENQNKITLNDENGNEIEFEFLDLVNYGDREYVVLLPVVGADEEDTGEVVILKIEDSKDGEGENYSSVNSEEELMAVFDIFKEKFADEFDFVD